jgi:hypothetical protein
MEGNELEPIPTTDDPSESYTAGLLSLSLDDHDPRATIEGGTQPLVNPPPVLRKIERLVVQTDHPVHSFRSRDTRRPSPMRPVEVDPSRPAGTHTPDGNRRSPAAGNSPSTSQVSVGSVNPTVVASAAKHFDLTPVTRNSAAYVEDTKGMVSPEEELQGVHLALPSDFGSGDGPSSSSTLPMQLHGRTRSVSALNEQMLWQHDAWLKEQEQIRTEPVQFARKFYTFTSREQYEDGIAEAAAEKQNNYSLPYLTPYQPSRDDDLQGVGFLPQEELSQIFIPRRSSTVTAGESHANHRLTGLDQPVNMDDRQVSIPSIHLAHPLQSSTTQSFTDHTDNTEEDEESLVYLQGGDDCGSLDASLSSSLYLPDDDKAPATGNPVLSLAPTGTFVMEELSRVMENARNNSMSSQRASDSSAGAVVGGGSRRKRKQRKREERAMDWLQSVEADGNVLAEAASSKFLLSQKVEHNATSTATSPKAERRQTLPSRGPIRSVVSDETPLSSETSSPRFHD